MLKCTLRRIWEAKHNYGLAICYQAQCWYTAVKHWYKKTKITKEQKHPFLFPLSSSIFPMNVVIAVYLTMVSGPQTAQCQMVRWITNWKGCWSCHGLIEGLSKQVSRGTERKLWTSARVAGISISWHSSPHHYTTATCSVSECGEIKTQSSCKNGWPSWRHSNENVKLVYIRTSRNRKYVRRNYTVPKKLNGEHENDDPRILIMAGILLWSCRKI
jgi:hypothetical protein